MRNAPNTLCTVPDCELPIRARGLCPKHHRRFLLYGDPTVMIGQGRRTDVTNRSERHKHVKVVASCMAAYRELKGSDGLHAAKLDRSAGRKPGLTNASDFVIDFEKVLRAAREPALLGQALIEAGLFPVEQYFS